ncbi:glutamyl-tRNA(Gln) amidotransferase subunit A [Thermoclostridium stercorarium subsp. stercorarium DSM 8532]|jgi:aspartyl-tRNA(Asn)/glutamyl-tRNA(Gln) amidotransferase subunit A|uniref:Glutamyl-tRNA(Gln) amidotransferase subunit A n=3 Tax=Thermoclostridium stercorarium TaxID=1510 RepID=L7VL54_THES1|nr:Asp-tRNA(Asn)/Glu-tRNA(Gln) amidotransferase subunit GatA [Thermoclostridium stercorarium]AGC68895.1 glutamyl-tRNA(Gln) amidotransferase subunit A [Thermoclostridium stercorarium subsp. stercorarium DSM 8532]AGI39885.1 aspartyl/glutamyl-tRNA amidotransferase subunit A [Thermoclostridium stercorarium subsp. stercorarium DSM 8532]ANW99195.1 aspartyl/glutamyl-tRNA amidotransferase subunit A [Thermoclostridium stercorarium subsp. thermolacticum DSM 2910]ANX01753.1 aspartyl/glutamyl-tRNA amidotra
MRMGITELAVKLRKREISAVELTKAYIDAIEKLNPTLNAYVHLTFDTALEAAEQADQMLKEDDAPLLCGIPMALKDNICTDGIPTTCCSKILEGFKPYYDATVWERLKKQGAVLLGKTNMDEFGMGSTSETSCYGAPLNPRNTNYVTGGSSGGSAAAICANLAVYSLGSDTGGSIRQPASFCGVVGLKPTYGAVSRYGLIAYGSSLDQIGPLTNSVKDAAIVFDAIKGVDRRDQTSVDYDYGSSMAECLDRDIKGIRIGVAEEFFDGINPEIKSKVEEAIKLFERNGAVIENIRIPAMKLALPVYYIIACAEASSNLGRYDGIRYGYRTASYSSIDDMIVKTRSEGFGDEVKRRIMLGTYVLSSGYYDAYYKKACLIREEINREFDAVFEKCDVLVAPTAPSTAFPLNCKRKSPVEMYLADICTVPVNIAGVPAISVPCGEDANGLPIGMQIIGRRFGEVTVLQVAHFYEQNAGQIIGAYEGGVRI